MVGDGSLTAMEVSALTDLAGSLNLTDGHARLPLSAAQSAIVASIPQMFEVASSRPFHDIEAESHAAFFSAVGQHTAPVGSGRILSCYSSTLATDIVARSLPAGSSMAVLHPTFDNIADLFGTRGLALVPLTEQALLAEEWPGPPARTVVVTHPNNPTGLVVSPDRLRSLAEHCVHNGQTLIVDASFRGQDRRAQYDMYAVLEAAQADWIVIEDTGKLWPTHELKVGMLAFSSRTRLPIRAAFSESLLSVSPVVLLMMARFAADWTNGGHERARRIIDQNRDTLADALRPVGLELADPGSRISVARVALAADGPDSVVLYRHLVQRGVHVLPCPPFHWSNPSEGLRFVRLSLSRPPVAVRQAATMLAEAYAELSVAVPA